MDLHSPKFLESIGIEKETLFISPMYSYPICAIRSQRNEVLRGISAVYDLLGFISPLTIPARILIQDIWKLKLDWDDPYLKI
jgi:hypothetical protein